VTLVNFVKLARGKGTSVDLFAINKVAGCVPDAISIVNDRLALAVETRQAFLLTNQTTGDRNMIKPLMIAISTMVFSSAAFAAAHTAAPATAPAKEEKTATMPAGSATKDATGKTEANRENKMSPTGQNETSSVSTSKKEAESSGGSSMKSK